MIWDRHVHLPFDCGIVFLAMILAAGILAPSQPASVQKASTPELHQRSNGSSSTAADAEADSSPGQVSTLPSDVSGAYQFDPDDGSVQIDIQRGKLTGYISRMGDAETDSDTPLTYFFDKASISGSHISFETRVLHGIWYSFDGTIFRGEGKIRSDEGYYVLHGTLEEHHPESSEDKSANQTIEALTVNFKSVGQ
jgi:hypothetical protein